MIQNYDLSKTYKKGDKVIYKGKEIIVKGCFCKAEWSYERVCKDCKDKRDKSVDIFLEKEIEYYKEKIRRIKSTIKRKPRFFKQAEFYMRRRDKAYFRNEDGEYIIDECTTFPLEYGKRYDSIIRHLVDSNGKILAIKDWD